MTGNDIYIGKRETAVLTWHSEDCVIKKTGEKIQLFLHKPSENSKKSMSR